MRRFLKILRIFVSLLCVTIVGLFLHAAILLGIVSIPRPLHEPRLGENVPYDFKKHDDGVFKKRILNEFSIGSDESKLRDELAKEGFKIEGKEAHFHQDQFVCMGDWYVSWKAAAGKIISMQAEYLQDCL